MSAAGAIVVIAEAADGGPSRLTCELLGLAQRLKADTGAIVAAAFLADRADAIADDLIALGADHVYCVEHAALEHYHSEAWVSAAAQLCRKVEPALVLIGHTSSGADLAPRLAFRLEGSVATGCVELSWRSGRFEFTRPCYGGNVHETLSFARGVSGRDGARGLW